MTTGSLPSRIRDFGEIPSLHSPIRSTTGPLDFSDCFPSLPLPRLPALSLAAGEVSPEVGWEVASLTLVLVWASWQCFRALEVGDIDLPGRDAEFWLANADSGNDRPTISRRYLEVFKERHQTNRSVSERQTRALRRAKLGGIIATLIGTGVGAILGFFQINSV